MLSDALGHDIERRIPLILYTSHNDFQQTNTIGGIIPEGVQGVTESLKHRVILPFTGSYADFNHVLTHELVHAFQFDVMSRSGRRMNPLQRAIPLWFMEGMAEFLSVGMDKGTETWVKDALTNDELVSVSELNLIGDIRVYRFGQALWYYIAETFGTHVVGELLQKAALLGNSAGAFSETLELSEEELTANWHEWVHENFQSTTTYQTPEDFAKRVTNHTGYYFNLNVIPAISPDGDRVAYLSNQNLYNDIILEEIADDGDKRAIVHGGRSGSFESLRFLDTQLSWSFDGRYIALVGESQGRDAIYIIDAEKGKRVNKITPDMDGIISPSWSPDGNRIVFTGIKNDQSDLFVIDSDGTGLYQLTDDVHSELQPQWSPDGATIAFATDRGNDTDIDKLLFGKLKIALYEISTGYVRVLTDVNENCHNPVWSPDGKRIAFIAPIEGPQNIYSVDVESKELQRITNLNTGVGGITPTSPAISWSRRGDSIAFSSFSRGGWDIFVMEDSIADSSHEVVETENQWSNTDYSNYPLPDDTEAEEKEFQSKFAPDMLVGGVGFSNNVGVAGQSYILISDILGNRNFIISTSVYGSLSESDLLFSYVNLTHRTNYALTAFQFRNDFGLFTAPDEVEFISQIYRGGGIVLSRPFSTFTRLEYGANAIFLKEDVFSQSFVTQEVTVDSSAVDFFVNPMIALVRDNSIYGPTGPIAGQRFRIQAEGGVGNISFTTLTGDYRVYFNFSRRYTLAYWLVGAGSFGDNKQIFRIGGPYTFRGADFGDFIGTRALIQSLEFRFPLLFMLPPQYDFLKGALFWDMAAAWDSDHFQPFTSKGTDFVRLKDLNGAYGAGVRVGLGFLVLRVDVAQQTDLVSHVGKARGFFSIGSDF
jgi:Tol biopolymer transport system component